METWLVSSSHVESLVHFTSTSGKFLWCAGNIIYKTYWVPISWSSTLTLSLAVSKSGVALRTYSYSAFIPLDQKVYVEVKSWYRTHRHASFMAFGATLQYQHKPPWDVVGWLLVWRGKGNAGQRKQWMFILNTLFFSAMEPGPEQAKFKWSGHTLVSMSYRTAVQDSQAYGRYHGRSVVASAL